MMHSGEDIAPCQMEQQTVCGSEDQPNEDNNRLHNSDGTTGKATDTSKHVTWSEANMVHEIENEALLKYTMTLNAVVEAVKHKATLDTGVDSIIANGKVEVDFLHEVVNFLVYTSEDIEWTESALYQNLAENEAVCASDIEILLKPEAIGRGAATTCADNLRRSILTRSILTRTLPTFNAVANANPLPLDIGVQSSSPASSVTIADSMDHERTSSSDTTPPPTSMSITDSMDHELTFSSDSSMGRT